MGYTIYWMIGNRYPCLFCIAWIPKISLNVFKCCDVILLSWSWKYINLHVQNLHVYLELHCVSWDFEECCPHFNAIKKNNRWVWLKWKTTFFFSFLIVSFKHVVKNIYKPRFILSNEEQYTIVIHLYMNHDLYNGKN